MSKKYISIAGIYSSNHWRRNSSLCFGMSHQYMGFDEVIDIIGNLDAFEQENPEYYI